MLGLAEEDTTNFHASQKEAMYLLGQGRTRSQRTVDWNIENPSVGQTTECTAEKAEHLPGKGLKYYHTNDLCPICERSRENRNDDLSAMSVTNNGVRKPPYRGFSFSHV